VRLGIEHGSSETSRSQEESSSNTNDNSSPDRKKSADHNLSLLSSVGEVVVSGAHEVEGSGLVHSNETSIEVLRSSVKLHAIAWISVDGILVIVVLLLQIGKREAIGLSKHAHPLSEFLGLKERGVIHDPSISSGHGGIKVRDLDHIASISPLSSFSCISSWVSITTSPLEVDVISGSSNKESWYKVVFGGWVGLDDVSSLSTNVQVENSLKGRNSRRSGSDVEHVRSVLEGSSELRSIKSQRNVESILRNIRILLNRGVRSVVCPINESSIRSVSVGTSDIVGGNIVSESHHAIAIVGSNAGLVFG